MPNSRVPFYQSTASVIDSPVPSSGSLDRSRDRGYDFEGCVKWFAEKADVILLFQDPGKPGTTGETMSVMTSALIGQGHKTHIIRKSEF